MDPSRVYLSPRRAQEVARAEADPPVIGCGWHTWGDRGYNPFALVYGTYFAPEAAGEQPHHVGARRRLNGEQTLECHRRKETGEVGEWLFVSHLGMKKDESLLIWWDSFLVLNLALQILHRARRFRIEINCFSCHRLDKDAHFF
ncbi:hypothetical protein PAPYR_1036 [Paratrimastix pyriformis]|uniref:Uncharacterized protein n=1 Tax=Paratrimastix pyriformis TaxID=342808 RepID=A0ABQ8UTE8_9EUKA|nr:hypothetical protein PAPYR_1036 [Paratrimastix pyriformis]